MIIQTILKTITRITAFLGLMAVVVLAAAPALPAAAAEQTQYVQLSPVSADIKVDPGGTATGRATVSNQGSDTFEVKAYASPYHVDGVDYTPNFTRLDGTTDASEWVSLAKTETTLNPNGVVDFDYTVKVPAATKPGGYYAVVFAEASPSTTLSQGVVSRNRVGQILYIRVNGEVSTAGSATAGELPTIQWGDNATIAVFVKNTGGTHFTSKVSAKVKNLFGKVVYESAQERYVLPQTERKVSFDWKSSGVFGIYTVERSATTPGGEVSLGAKMIVVIQPVFAIVAVLLVLLVAGTLTLRTKKSPRRRRR